MDDKSQQSLTPDTLMISVPVSEATNDTLALISADGQSAYVTPGSRSLIDDGTSKVGRVANRFWAHATLENVLFLVLSRFSEHRPQAVHHACAYALSTFGGLPQYVLSQEDCIAVAKILSNDLSAEIDAYEKALERARQRDADAKKAPASSDKATIQTTPNHDPDPTSIDPDSSDDDDYLSHLGYNYAIQNA